MLVVNPGGGDLFMPGAIPGATDTTGPVPPQQNNGAGASPIPGVSSYAQAALQAKTAYQKALAQLNSNRTTALHQFGYRGDINPDTGVLTNMSVDPNNPYGSYQSMLNAHADMQKQVESQNMARGLGHGGLAAQGLTAEHKSFGADSSQLGTQIMQALEGFQGQQSGAENTMNSALYQAQLLAAQQAIANGNFDTAGAGSSVFVPGSGTDFSAANALTDPATELANAGGKLANIVNSAVTNTGRKAPAKKPILPNAYNTTKKRG